MDYDQQHELETRVFHGDAVDRFLSDPTIQSVFRDQKLEYFDEWFGSETPAQRELLWAKARALDDLDTALRRVVASGQRAKHDLSAARDG